MRCLVHPEQVAGPLQGQIKADDRAHSHTLSQSDMHVFGLWEEAEVPGEVRENMEIPHKS